MFYNYIIIYRKIFISVGLSTSPKHRNLQDKMLTVNEHVYLLYPVYVTITFLAAECRI